mmetsp:Transcript_15811/g.37213  ORF Transcript_15811/g.37213 Transcript_15811/m.37213 type:complete len:129 (+) Transcript_15811:165-551(+)
MAAHPGGPRYDRGHHGPKPAVQAQRVAVVQLEVPPAAESQAMPGPSQQQQRRQWQRQRPPPVEERFLAELRQAWDPRLAAHRVAVQERRAPVDLQEQAGQFSRRAQAVRSLLRHELPAPCCRGKKEGS